MCGHVGIAGKLEFKDEKVIRNLLLLDYLRGPDSTGVAVYRKSGEVKIAKGAVNPLDLFDMTRYKSAVAAAASTVFLGHNRLATKGVVNNVNAHPYEYDHIVGAHNGTLNLLSLRALEKELGEDFEVDSMAIIAGIARLGVEKTVSLLEGAWALVWIDMAEKTLNFLRNNERPFYYAYSKELDKVLWASDWRMIQLATSPEVLNQDYPLFAEKYEDGKTSKYFEATPNWWYRFELEKLAKGADIKHKPKVKEVKGKEPAPVVHHTHTYGSHSHGSPFHVTGTPNGGQSSGAGTTTSNVVVLFQPTETAEPLGEFVTRERFEQLAQYGCSYCSADVDYFDVGVTVWPSREQVLCPGCSTDAGSNRIYMEPTQFAQANIKLLKAGGTNGYSCRRISGV